MNCILKANNRVSNIFIFSNKEANPMLAIRVRLLIYPAIRSTPKQKKKHSFSAVLAFKSFLDLPGSCSLKRMNS